MQLQRAWHVAPWCILRPSKNAPCFLLHTAVSWRNAVKQRGDMKHCQQLSSAGVRTDLNTLRALSWHLPQTHPSGDLLLVELVACLSVLRFQLQNTKARQSIAPWWSVSSMHWKTVFRILKMHLNPTAYPGAAGNVFYCCTGAVLQCLFQVLAAYLAHIICWKLSAFITFAMVFEHLASFTSSLQYGELLLPAGSGWGTGGDGVSPGDRKSVV